MVGLIYGEKKSRSVFNVAFLCAICHIKNSGIFISLSEAPKDSLSYIFVQGKQFEFYLRTKMNVLLA